MVQKTDTESPVPGKI